jgi:DNA-binding transcriptional regulator YhcF (GntR family)
MSQYVPQNEPLEIPRNAYPMVRISSEFFLRSVDLLTRVQNDRLISGLVFMAVWDDHMHEPGGAVGVRELARRLNLPYETVRRHAMELVRAGQFSATREGIAVVPAVLRSRANVDVMRKLYLNTERMLVELTRAGLAKYKVPARSAARRRNLTPDQMVIATASTRQLLAGIRMLGDLWQGDLLRALVFTAIWTANVKHVTNTAPAASQTVLSDDQRLPVSVLAISSSLRLPYETVRRHAMALEKAGICYRVGRQGLVVPAEAHLRMASGTVQAHAILTALLADLRRAGLKA